MAHKLPTPGVAREKLFGEGAGAGAVATQGRGGVLAHPSVRRDGDTWAGAGSGVGAEARGAGVGVDGNAISITQTTVLASSPPPLASRSGVGAKQESMPSPSTALGSSWIRRVLPFTPDLASGEVGLDAGSSVPSLAPDAARAIGGGSHSVNALTFRPMSPTQNLRSAEGHANAQCGREPTGKILGDGHCTQKGKKLQDLFQGQQMSAPGHYLTDDPSDPRNPGRTFAIENVQHQGISRGAEVVPHSIGRHGRSDEPERMVTGFGSLRVLVKSRANDGKKDEKLARGSRPPLFPEKLNALEADDALAAGPAAGIQRNGFRIPTVISSIPRPPLPGKQIPVSAPQADHRKDPKFGTELDRPSRHMATGGYPVGKEAHRLEAELDEGELGMVHLDRAAGKTLSQCVASDELETYVGAEAAFGRRVESSSPNAAPIERSGSNKLLAEVPSHHRVSLGTNDNYVRRAETVERLGDGGGLVGRLVGRLGSLVESSKATENRALNGVPSGGNMNRHRDIGTSNIWHSPDASAHGPRQVQGDSSPVGNLRHSSPFTPHAAVTPGEESEGLIRGVSRRDGDQTQPLLTPLFGSPRRYPDGSEAQVRRNENQAPWTSVFSSFEGQKQQESYGNIPPQSVELLPNFHPRFYNGSVPNCFTIAPRESDNHRNKADPYRVSGTSPSQGLIEGRGPFNVPPSQFPRASWPEGEGQDPNEDVDSCPHNNSRRTGSHHQSPAGSVPRTASDSRDSHKHRKGVENLVPARLGKLRESFADEGGFGRFAGHPEEDGGSSRMPNDRNQGHLTSSPRYAYVPTTSGRQNDYTSGSSPPSYPAGYNNSSDMGSPVLGGIDQLRGPAQPGATDADFDMDGDQAFLRHNESYLQSEKMRSRRGKGLAEILTKETESVNGDYKDGRDLFGKDLDAQKIRPPDGLGFRDVNMHVLSAEGESAGDKHGRSLASDAMGDGDTAGPAKKNRYNLDSSETKPGHPGSTGSAQAKGAPSPSVWLQRWIKPSGSSHPTFTRPRETSGDAFHHMQRGFGGTNFMQRFGARQEEGDPAGGGTEAEDRSQMRSGRRGMSGVQAFVSNPTPSAAALALASAAARKPGPVPQQRRGSLNFWAPVRLPTADPPKDQESP